MKSKWTILLAVLLLAVLAMPQLAEAQGYDVRRGSAVTKVAESANNALVNNLTLVYNDTADAVTNIANAPTGEMLTIKIGYGLLITNDDTARLKETPPFTLWCNDDGNLELNGYEAKCQFTDPETSPSATISNDGGTGVITVTIPEPDAANKSFVVAGVRVDASALEIDDLITASITSTTDATSVPLGGDSAEGGVAGVVGKVAAALLVTATTDTDLACSVAIPEPSITLTEGFAGAWGPTNLEFDEDGAPTSPAAGNNQTASLRIVLDNLPDDAKVEWPSPVLSKIDIAASGADADLRTNGMLTLDTAETSSTGKVAVYTYTKATMTGSGVVDDANTPDMDESMMAFAAAQAGAARSFEIVPKKTTFTGDASVNVSASLFPMARKGTDGEKLNLDEELSFEQALVAPEKGNGDNWLVISECVTYLLYPFVTCGATDGWDTGISVSNTTADGNIFGAFDATTEQNGAVVMYGFPKLTAEAPMVDPVIQMVAANLKAGDTTTFQCSNTTMVGMEGYAIVKASFQHARGMAFVVGNFPDGAGLDVAHGYIAEVINDPGTRSDKIGDE